jgi:dehydrogenase/reductase SDR family protein 4
MEKQRFKGKIVLLTGASTGIGFSTAQRFGKEGATVIITSRKSHKI